MTTYSESIEEIENLFRDLNYLKCILRRINDIANKEFLDPKLTRISLFEAYDENSLEIMSATVTITIPLSGYSSTTSNSYVESFGSRMSNATITIINDYVESFRKRIADAIIICAKAVLIDNNVCG